MPKKQNFNTRAILKDVYPIIENSMNKNMMALEKMYV